MLSKLRPDIFLGLIVSTVLIIAAPQAMADRDLSSIGELADAASVIAIGQLGTVETAATGAQRVELKQIVTLRGDSNASIVINGSQSDPGLAELFSDSIVVAFLNETRGSSYAPVNGDHGLIRIKDDAIDSTEKILSEMIDPASNADFDEMVKSIQQDPVPNVLISSYLKDVSASTNQQNVSLISNMACNSSQDFNEVFQLWAMTEAGRRKVESARECLETIATTDIDSRKRISAIETLGDIANAESIEALSAMMPETVDRADGLVIGSNDDPATSFNNIETETALLAIGKIGTNRSLKILEQFAKIRSDQSLSSTAVHAIGLVGTGKAAVTLRDLSQTLRDSTVRQQARQTLKQIR